MIKEIIAYILLFFGVIVAIIGTVFYLRTYKAMIGSTPPRKQIEPDKPSNHE